jgi:hypothetical protein
MHVITKNSQYIICKTEYLKLTKREKPEIITYALHTQKQKLLTWPIINNLC